MVMPHVALKVGQKQAWFTEEEIPSILEVGMSNTELLFARDAAVDSIRPGRALFSLSLTVLISPKQA